METTWISLYQALLFSSAGILIFVTFFTLKRRNKSAAIPLLFLILGSLIYISVKLLVSFNRGTPHVFYLTRLNPLGAGIATISYLILVVEYTGFEQPVSKRTVGLLMIEPLVANCLIWLDINFFWKSLGRDLNTISGFSWELQSIGIMNQLYMNLVMISGLLLLVWFWQNTGKPFKRQITALFLAGIIPLIGNSVFYLNILKVNPTPFLFVISGLFISWAILWDGLLDIVPISRQVVLENIDAGVITVDQNDKIVDINQAGCRIFDIKDTGQILGNKIDQCFDEYPALLDIYFSRDDSDSNETQQMTLNESFFEVVTKTLKRQHGTPLGYSIIIRDITQRIRRKKKLENQNNQLERLVSVISHDVRNPLSVIQGRVKFARDGEDVDSQLDAIQTNADRVMDIIENVLSVTRGFDLHPKKSVEVSDVARKAWQHVDTRQAGLQITTDLKITADKQRLLQLFENLFRNAVEHGGSQVTVFVDETRNAETGEYGFLVSDNGVGMQETESSLSTNGGGISNSEGKGLGLSIVSEIAEAHGWELNIGNSDAGGACFSFYGVDIHTES